MNTPPPAGGVFDAYGIGYFAVFTFGFLVSAHLAGPGAESIAGAPERSAHVRHWATVGLWIFGPGLFFFLIRALQINPLSFGEPIWLVGCILALLVALNRWIDRKRSRG